MRAMVGRRQIKLSWHQPQIDCVHVLGADAEFAVLSAGSGREHIVIALPQLIDHAVAGRVDVREFALKDKSTDDEIMVRMHVVAAARAVKNLVTKYADRPE